MKTELDREQVILFTPHHRIEGDLSCPRPRGFPTG